MRTEIRLPFPPSVNQLYATNWKTKRRYKTGKYNEWQKDAGWKLKTQKRQNHSGRVAVTYFAKRPDNRKRDIDNLSKAICDFLVLHQIISDDRHIGVLHCAWANNLMTSEVIVIIEDLA